MRNLQALAAAAALALPAAAQADTAADYQLFALRDLSLQGASVSGRVAVGGNATLQGVSIALGVPASNVNLAVDGNLSVNGGSVKGKFVAGGTFAKQNFNAAQYQAGAAVPVDFDAEGARLAWLTGALSDYAANGLVDAVDYGAHGTQITLDGRANAGLSVFRLSDLQLSDTNTLTIRLQPGQDALINVSGLGPTFYNAGVNIVGGDASNILWNFSEAQTLDFYGVGLKGSVLAPFADYRPTGSGGIDGQVFVESFTGDWSQGATTIAGVANRSGLLGLQRPLADAGQDLRTGVPEPTGWTMMILGFGGLGGLLRRKRALAA